MPYTPPSVATFKAKFIRFAAVADATVQAFLDEAAGRVDETWAEGDFAQARMLFAAHSMLLEGLGAGAESVQHAKGLGEFRVMRSGALTLERFNADRTAAVDGLLAQTSYGRRFLELLALNHAGPIFVPAYP